MIQGSESGTAILYLLDANVLITANRDYYPVKRVPEFWAWLEHHAAADRVKMPAEILHEVKRGPRRKGMDDLLDWLRKDSVKDALVLNQQPDPRLVRRVIEHGYAPDLREDEIQPGSCVAPKGMHRPGP